MYSPLQYFKHDDAAVVKYLSFIHTYIFFIFSA